MIAVSSAIERVPDCEVYVFKDRRSKPIANVVLVTPDTVRVNPTTTFVRGEYGNSKLSGPLAVYWAINHGATEIDIVGFEGLIELQDGIPGGAYVEQARILRNTAAGCPDVTFRYYGELTWDIDGDNVEVIA